MRPWDDMLFFVVLTLMCFLQWDDFRSTSFFCQNAHHNWLTKEYISNWFLVIYYRPTNISNDTITNRKKKRKIQPFYIGFFFQILSNNLVDNFSFVYIKNVDLRHFNPTEETTISVILISSASHIRWHSDRTSYRMKAYKCHKRWTHLRTSLI